MPYTGPQLRLLLVLAAILLSGLGVREWRSGFPDAAQRIEGFDRQEAMAPALPASPAPRDAPPTTPADSNIPASTPVPRASSPASSGADPRPLDLNRATAAELARLPGVSAGLAQRILEERQRRGKFDSPESLRYVMGVGPKKLAALRDLVTVGP
jgi:DNA uptake protein ComE-like DNA-binding protein